MGFADQIRDKLITMIPDYLIEALHAITGGVNSDFFHNKAT